MGRKARLTLLVLIIVGLGFLRGYVFYNINWIYMTLTNGRMNQARNEFHFFLKWTPTQINILKWILTFVFTFLFYYLTHLIIKTYFNDKTYTKIVLYTFIGLLLASGFFYSLGLLAGNLSTLYGIVLTLMGIAQSFMPLMFLFVLFRFLPEGK